MKRITLLAGLAALLFAACQTIENEGQIQAEAQFTASAGRNDIDGGV